MTQLWLGQSDRVTCRINKTRHLQYTRQWWERFITNRIWIIYDKTKEKRWKFVACFQTSFWFQISNPHEVFSHRVLFQRQEALAPSHHRSIHTQWSSWNFAHHLALCLPGSPVSCHLTGSSQNICMQNFSHNFNSWRGVRGSGLFGLVVTLPFYLPRVCCAWESLPFLLVLLRLRHRLHFHRGSHRLLSTF